MEDLQKIKESIVEIEKRNKRVELEKAWEVSNTRIISIIIVTYAIAVILFYFLGSKNPWTNALVPTVGFYLSTQSISFIKRVWIKNKKDQSEN